MKISGVYLIRNLITQKIYMGSSIAIKECWRRHKYRLNKGTHRNSQLQKDYDMYGPGRFDFSIQELCNQPDLLNRETHWVNFYDSMDPDKGYNCVLPNNLKIHRKTIRINNLKTIICINILTKEIKKLTITQIQATLNIKSKSVYKGIRYWLKKSEGRRSIKGWMFTREQDYNEVFDYIGYDRLQEWRDSVLK